MATGRCDERTYDFWRCRWRTTPEYHNARARERLIYTRNASWRSLVASGLLHSQAGGYRTAHGLSYLLPCMVCVLMTQISGVSV